MRYRKLSPTGDYTFGQGSLSFYIDNPEAVAQAIKTRLQLLKATFWRDLSDGLPLFQEILAASGSAQHLAAIDAIYQQRIAGTQGVQEILSFSSVFNRETRQYSYQARVQTIYSLAPVVIQGAA